MTNAACVRTEPLSSISSIIAPCTLNRECLPGATTTSLSISARQSPPASILTIVLKFYVTSKNSPKEKPTTVPIECSVTYLISDLHLFWKACKKEVIIELTVAFELNIEKAYETCKYTALVLDIISKGFEFDIIALEIGSGGYTSPDIQHRLKFYNNPTTFKNFQDISASSLPFCIFHLPHLQGTLTWDKNLLLSISFRWVRPHSSV